MSVLQEEVEMLRKRLVEKEAVIEQQKREAIEKKERSWGFNMGILKRIYKDKKLDADARIGELKKIESYNNRHPHLTDSGQDKSLDAEIAQQKNSYEQDAVLFRLFKHIGEELWEMECKIERSFTNLDERLAHIERCLEDDI